MARQMQRTHAVSKPKAEEADERPERDERAEGISEEAECCLADIDAVIEDACCLLAEVSEVVEQAPTEEQFTAERNRLKDIYYGMAWETAAKNEAWANVIAYEDKWPQHSHLCTC